MAPSLLDSPVQTRYAPASDGYIRVRLENGRVVEEHRVVMARALGRDLQTWEIVRHLNGDRSDNALSNLMLDERADGTKGHQNAPHTVSLACSRCGQTFVRRASEVALSLRRGQTRFFCGRVCVGKSFGRGKSA